MINIVLVFTASMVIFASIAYILYSYVYDNVENFGVPSRTQTQVSENKNCNSSMYELGDEEEDDDAVDDDDAGAGDEIISMEDVLKLRNNKGETVT